MQILVFTYGTGKFADCTVLYSNLELSRCLASKPTIRPIFTQASMASLQLFAAYTIANII